MSGQRTGSVSQCVLLAIETLLCMTRELVAAFMLGDLVK